MADDMASNDPRRYALISIGKVDGANLYAAGGAYSGENYGEKVIGGAEGLRGSITQQNQLPSNLVANQEGISKLSSLSTIPVTTQDSKLKQMSPEDAIALLNTPYSQLVNKPDVSVDLQRNLLVTPEGKSIKELDSSINVPSSVAGKQWAFGNPKYEGTYKPVANVKATIQSGKDDFGKTTDVGASHSGTLYKSSTGRWQLIDQRGVLVMSGSEDSPLPKFEEYEPWSQKKELKSQPSAAKEVASTVLNAQDIASVPDEKVTATKKQSETRGGVDVFGYSTPFGYTNGDGISKKQSLGDITSSKQISTENLYGLPISGKGGIKGMSSAVNEIFSTPKSNSSNAKVIGGFGSKHNMKPRKKTTNPQIKSSTGFAGMIKEMNQQLKKKPAVIKSKNVVMASDVLHSNVWGLRETPKALIKTPIKSQLPKKSVKKAVKEPKYESAWESILFSNKKKTTTKKNK